MLGPGAAPTYRVGDVDSGGFDGHDVRATADVFGAGGVSCGDDVDRWAWAWPICMIAACRTRFEANFRLASLGLDNIIMYQHVCFQVT